MIRFLIRLLGVFAYRFYVDYNLSAEMTLYLDGAHTVDSIQNCASWFKEESFKEKVYNELSINATQDQKIEFITRHFSILQSNLSNYNRMKTVEAIEIKLKKTILNNQIFSRTVNIF